MGRDRIFLWDDAVESVSLFDEGGCKAAKVRLFLVDVREEIEIACAVVVLDAKAGEDGFGLEGGLEGGFVLLGEEEAFGSAV